MTKDYPKYFIHYYDGNGDSHQLVTLPEGASIEEYVKSNFSDVRDVDLILLIRNEEHLNSSVFSVDQGNTFRSLLDVSVERVP